MSQNINNIYDELLKVAKACASKAKLRESAGDVVSEAFLLCDNANPTKEEFIHAIGFYCKKHKYDYLSEIKTDVARQVIDQCCTECKEIIPIAMFDFVHDDSMFSYYRRYCKDCRMKKRREWNKLVGYWKKDSIKTKARARAKKYWEREKNKLSDKYIYHRILRRHRKPSEITTEMVLERRNQIIEKRAKKRTSLTEMPVKASPPVDKFCGLPVSGLPTLLLCFLNIVTILKHFFNPFFVIL